ncbi:uncharacterized protein LOC110811077 isoform X2 [Carica papaya]|uniref:uncharacterized protein LOC110811077 isoform X2 n=1 Tax=Carica papaya TaxID=3649 RepID=UPI000B8CEB76|nr:uncharacterized protein LOC110811077 isoform X2 [Carica papaya]
MPITRDPSTPPPMIGKIGPYTVFMTPPSTPKPVAEPISSSPKPVMPPPVQPPPQQFHKPVVSHSVSDGSVAGFFKNAVTKVQSGKGRCKSKRDVWQSTERVVYFLVLV